MKGRLTTGDRNRRWNGGFDVSCVLCNDLMETKEHLSSDLGGIDERYIAKQIYSQLGRDYENHERHFDGENEVVHYQVCVSSLGLYGMERKKQKKTWRRCLSNSIADKTDR